MPRLLDHDERDREIGEAAMRVLARDGLAGLSVRKVAEEAGLATASLRRAFPTQDALRRFCLDRIQRAVAARILALTGEGLPLALRMLGELLPLDDTRRTELVVQLQLGSLALTDESLQDGVRELSDGVRDVCAAALEECGRAGMRREGLDLDFEADRLHALLDGLALHLLWRPAPGAAERARGLLERHFAGL